ncbi:MAG: hypothetical protein ACT4P1_13125 [Sporichthyaceae bacterium]
MSRFEISRVQVDIAGPQAYTLDAHISTRTGTPSEVVSVMLGQMVIYVYDLAAARAFAAVWRTALGYAPVGLPDQLDDSRVTGATSEAGALLHIAGVPDRRRIHGIAVGASPTGRPHVRVELGRLIVHAHDLVAVTSAAAAWDSVERTAARVWPEVDAFEQVQVTRQRRLAKTGRVQAEVETWVG